MLWVLRVGLFGAFVLHIHSAYGLTRIIASFLYGVKALDPMVFVGIPLLLTFVAFVAVWVPARRASLVNPVTALRMS